MQCKNLFLIAGLICWNTTIFCMKWNFFDKDKKPFDVVQLTSKSDVKEIRTLFFGAFSETCKQIPLEILKAESHTQYLQQRFDSIEKNLKEGAPDVYLISALREGKTIGFSSFKKKDNGEVFVEWAVVRPEEQRKKILRSMALVIPLLIPTVKKVCWTTLKSNAQVRAVYKRLGVPEIQNARVGGCLKEHSVGFEIDVDEVMKRKLYAALLNGTQDKKKSDSKPLHKLNDKKEDKKTKE